MDVRTSATVRAIVTGGVVIEERGESSLLTGYDNVVLALGTRSDNQLAAELSSFNRQVVVVGDAAKPGDALEALLATRKIALTI